MNDELKIIQDAQQRTAWTQSWWAVALVALGIGSSLALSKVSWWYTLAILIPTFILGFLLKDKIANPFVRPNPNKGPRNDRATWSRVVLPLALIMSTTPTPNTWPWMISCGVIVTGSTAWMLYENSNSAVKGINV